MELVDQARVEALQDRVGAAGDADVPAAGRLAGPVECAADAVIDEVERGAALPLPRVASLVRHDEHRRVERRVLGPGVLAGVEHAFAHHVRAGPVEGPGHDVVVATLLAAGAEVQVLPDVPLREEPCLELPPLPAHQLFGGSRGDVPVQGHRDAEEHFPGHRFSASFLTPSVR